MSRWLTEPVPRGRVAAFRTLVYLFVAADLVVFTPWVRTRVAVPGELYQPLLIGRLLPLPTPTPARHGARRRTGAVGAAAGRPGGRGAGRAVGQAPGRPAGP